MDITLDLETNYIEAGVPLEWLQKVWGIAYAYDDPDTGEEVSGFLPLHMYKLDEIRHSSAGEIIQAWLYETPNFHNAPFDVSVLRYLGFDVPYFHCTQVMGYLLNPNIQTIYQPGHKPSKYSVWAWGIRLGMPKMDAPNFSEWSDELGVYAANDAHVQWNLFKYLKRLLLKDADAWEHYVTIERPFIECIIEMAETGLLIDVEELGKLVDELTAELSEMEAKMIAEAGIVPTKTVWYRKQHDEPKKLVYIGERVSKKDGKPEYGYKILGEFNPGSAEQTAWVLINKYGWEPEEFGDSGKPKTSKDILSKLEYPLAEWKVEYNAIRILLKSFAKAFLTKRDRYGYVHCNINQTVAKTGRLSSSNPNLQNIPANSKRGSRFRACIIAEEGYDLVGIDLQAIEYRVLAALQYDYFLRTTGVVPDDIQFMVDVFNHDPTTEDGDIHTQMANLWLSIVRYPDRNKARKVGKNISYGRMFGFGNQKAGKMIGCTTEEAKELVDEANRMNPSFQIFRESVWEEFKQGNGLGHTYFGRRLYYPKIALQRVKRDQVICNGKVKVKGKHVYEEIAKAERQSFNAKIQGTAADIIKKLNYPAMLLGWDYGARLLLQVHDELLFMCPHDTSEKLRDELNKQFYFKPGQLLPGVPVMGDAHIGKRWLDVH